MTQIMNLVNPQSSW